MLAAFSLFGRSKEIRRFDSALIGAGLDPRAVEDAVKIAALRLTREAEGRDLAEAAELLSYCLLGPEDFAAATDAARAAAIEVRLAHAPDAPDGPDARLVLLALASGQAHPAVAERFAIES